MLHPHTHVQTVKIQHQVYLTESFTMFSNGQISRRVDLA